MSKGLGQPMVVENKPGAAGTLGAGEAARSAPDGYTLLVTPGGHAIFGAIFKTLPFDTVESFEWVSNIVTIPFFVVVPANSEFRTLPDIIAKAKASPGTVTSAAQDPDRRITSASNCWAAGPAPNSCTCPTAATRRGHRACSPARCSSALATPTPAAANIKAGKLRALAIASNTRRAGRVRCPDRGAGARHSEL